MIVLRTQTGSNPDDSAGSLLASAAHREGRKSLRTEQHLEELNLVGFPSGEQEPRISPRTRKQQRD